MKPNVASERRTQDGSPTHAAPSDLCPPAAAPAARASRWCQLCPCRGCCPSLTMSSSPGPMSHLQDTPSLLVAVMPRLHQAEQVGSVAAPLSTAPSGGSARLGLGACAAASLGPRAPAGPWGLAAGREECLRRFRNSGTQALRF